MQFFVLLFVGAYVWVVVYNLFSPFLLFIFLVINLILQFVYYLEDFTNFSSRTYQLDSLSIVVFVPIFFLFQIILQLIYLFNLIFLTFFALLCYQNELSEFSCRKSWIRVVAGFWQKAEVLFMTSRYLHVD